MMKRVLSVLLVCVVFMTLVACTPKESEIDKLQQNITQLQQQLEQLESSGALVQQQLTDLQKEKELLQKKLDNLTGEPIAFTAEAPVYGPKENLIIGHSFDNASAYDSKIDPFGDFFDCYINKISPIIDSEICFLDPGEGIGSFQFNEGRYKTYTIYDDANSSSFSPIIHQFMEIGDETLGDDDYTGEDGEKKWSFLLHLYSAPVSCDNIRFRRMLEFGDNATFEGKYKSTPKTYINIYLNDVNRTCIGTCYYRANSYISAKWFTDYFNNKYNAKLYYGGTMFP